MNKSEKITLLLNYLDEILPSVGCELIFHHDYECVIAVMLSAQTTDKAVNAVTIPLFNKYKTLESLANASVDDVGQIIKSLGLYKNKAKNVVGICQKLLLDFNGVVPSNKDDLQTLPGVGNKTAGVVRAEVHKIPDFPVDTHIIRITNRLGFATSKDTPLDIELKMKKLVPESRWILAHHQLIHFGRYYCKATSPNCESCKLKDICKRK